MRIVNILNPTWLLIENVPRLLSINEGRDFAVVLQTLSESGYGYSWRILDSQYFGVAQRRKRVFIVGCFGRECPPEILFEQKSGGGNDKKKQKMGQRGLCISAKCGERQDPTSDAFIASTIRVNRDGQGSPFKFAGENLVAKCLDGTNGVAGWHLQEGRKSNLIAEKVGALTAKSYGDKGWALNNEWNTIVAQTLNTSKRGNAGRIWEDTHIAETNSDGKRKTSRIPDEFYSCQRGVVIGNAVTVNVAHWIGERILKYGRTQET